MLATKLSVLQADSSVHDAVDIRAMANSPKQREACRQRSDTNRRNPGAQTPNSELRLWAISDGAADLSPGGEGKPGSGNRGGDEERGEEEMGEKVGHRQTNNPPRSRRDLPEC